MLLPDELGPVMILTLPCDSELWKELGTNTGEHSSNSGCLENHENTEFAILYGNNCFHLMREYLLYLPCETVIVLCLDSLGEV